MTKTKELEECCLKQLIECGKLTVLATEDAMMSPSADAPVKLVSVLFPSPSCKFGQITHAVIPNPRHRWWTFWRPRT